LAPRALIEGYLRVFKTRVTAGYMVASGSLFGALFAFISSSEQLYSDVYDRSETFTLYFATVAGMMGIAAYANSKLVERWGMRRLAHGALVVFVAINVISVLALRFGDAGFAAFHGSMLASFFCFAFIGANFNSLAMEPLGEIAGTGSAALGFASTLLAGTLGGFVGQQFDGTATPVIIGFFALGLVSLVVVLITERGHLFGHG
jgi:DHA1 family bicyclomycin/chloramphenicol resistance-like MFS transporter